MKELDDDKLCYVKLLTESRLHTEAIMLLSAETEHLNCQNFGLVNTWDGVPVDVKQDDRIVTTDRNLTLCSEHIE